MRSSFWSKLDKDQRTFKWFFDNYIKDKRRISLKYNTIYQQAKGEFLDNLHPELHEAMMDYVNNK